MSIALLLLHLELIVFFSAFGAAIGGPLGGLLGDSIGWRSAFLIQVPICVLHFTIVAWKVDIPSGPGDIIRDQED